MSVAIPDDPAAYLVLAGIGFFLAVAIGLSLYWGVSTHLIWASRVRGLLEQEGFRARHMERRWLTRGPFPDMRPPGVKHHNEWLVRVVAEDREHRPRAGWVRWRRKWPWEAADTWTVRWDEGPWSGQWGDAPAARKRGLSTTVFMTLVLPPALAGMGIGVYLLVRGIEEQQPRNDVAAQQTAGASAPSSGISTATVYEIRCRGGSRDTFRIEQLAAGTAQDRAVVLMSLRFTPSETAAGADGAGLAPGTCSWLDRPLNAQEPRVIRFEVSGIRAPEPPHTIRPAPGSFPDDDYLTDPTRYWSFLAFNFNAGYLQATSHGRWTKPR